MRRVTVLLIAAALSWIAPVARAPSASACTCVKSTVRQQFAGATHVFVGSVAAVEESAGNSIATFSVQSVYKGRVAETIQVVVAAGNGCSVEFLPGNHYTVFARMQTSVVTTNLCYGTSDDTRVLARAGEFQVVSIFDDAGRADLTLPAGESRARPISIAFALLLAAAAGFAGLRRSRSA